LQARLLDTPVLVRVKTGSKMNPKTGNAVRERVRAAPAGRPGPWEPVKVELKQAEGNIDCPIPGHAPF
jgi:hypothetical protein